MTKEEIENQKLHFILKKHLKLKVYGAEGQVPIVILSGEVIDSLNEAQHIERWLNDEKAN